MTAEVFSSLRQALSNHFPIVEERLGRPGTIDLSPGTAPSAKIESIVRGIFFKSEDSKLVAQFRVDGFTLNAIWGKFEQLRHFKNSIFFNYLTDEFIRSFE